ncbi:MAG: hypothetical protein LBM98_07005 [Oscillospiraceae bacterium]|nr:hypothetical protein [Oscillospiraceae bacterium]
MPRPDYATPVLRPGAGRRDVGRGRAGLKPAPTSTRPNPRNYSLSIVITSLIFDI